METKIGNRPHQMGRFCAKYSFILGSLILLAFVFTGIHTLKIIGLIYFVTAAGINLIVLFILFINLLIHPHRYLDILKTMAIMLLNIPVAIFYLWLTEQIHHIVL